LRQAPAFADLSADLSAEASAKAEGYGEAGQTGLQLGSARQSLAYS
jgi:hypothetical protein